MKNSIAFIFIFILSFLAMNVFSQNNIGDSTEMFHAIYIAEDVESSNASNTEVILYPNYTSGKVYVDFGDASGRNNSFMVFDNSGTFMLQENMNGNRVVLDLSVLSEGVYFIRIATNNHFETKKIVILKEIIF
jgi:hypothetical protein